MIRQNLQGIQNTKTNTDTIFISSEEQVDHFKGCTYIISQDSVFTEAHGILGKNKFNSTFGGSIFHLASFNDKQTTNNAWEAFTGSFVNRYPMAHGTCFRPDKPPSTIINGNVNIFKEVITKRVKGSARPFLDHINKLLPKGDDANILLSYMACLVQNKGHKFAWAPLVQGVQGNGKSLLTKCLIHCIGRTYTHTTQTKTLKSDKNGWLFGKVLITIEEFNIGKDDTDIKETLKTMITEEVLENRSMYREGVSADNRANFFFNTNHRDAWSLTESDRRIAVFYCAQQNFSDLERDGMGADYFNDLFSWLEEDGYAIVNEFLSTFVIDHKFSPLGGLKRAPKTSATQDAIVESLSEEALTIMEAIENSLVGFRGGFISSIAVRRLLTANNQTVGRKEFSALMRSISFIKHPKLTNGRLGKKSPVDNSDRPYIYVKANSDHVGTKDSSSVVSDLYITAQTKEGE